MQPGAMKFLEGMEEGSDKYKDTWEKLNSVPVRLHVLNGVDWEGTQEGMEKDRPKVERVHGSKFGKEYKVDQ